MNKLSSDTARLISSLQVITKVESVVKELVENALDAGATCVEVKFENYGLSKIEVRDNGSGIKQSDIEFAAQRHYTSKISCKEDLMSLHSYGFRGEALSSLCDVSEVFITTRTKDDKFSTKYSFNQKGIIIATKPCHLVQGTTVVANNLFSKMPVRCQFYQTQSKRKQILKNTEDVLISFALIHPEKRFSFFHNKCVIWEKPGCKNLRSALETVLSSSVVSRMIQAEHRSEEKDILMSSFIPVTKNTRHFRKTNDRCFISINKRPVRDKEIEKVIKQHTTVPNSSSVTAKWPVAFVSIQVPVEQVDSNVESDKSRVLISGKDVVITALAQMLSETYAALPENFEIDEENCDEVRDGECANAGKQRLEEKSIDDVRSSDLNASCNDQDPEQAVASEWSKGQSAKDASGQPVQPVKILAGHHGRPASEMPQKPRQVSKCDSEQCKEISSGNQNTLDKHLLQEEADLGEIFASEIEKEVSFGNDSAQQEVPALKLKQTSLNADDTTSRTSRDYMPVQTCAPSLDSAKPLKRKRQTSGPVSDDVHNASLITKWVTQTAARNNPSPALSEVSEGDGDYAEVVQIDLKFDFSTVKENLFYKEDFVYAKRDPYSVIGVLRDIKAGVIVDSSKCQLFLVNLMRLQETKLFWSLMENHALQTKELPSPLAIAISSLSNDEAKGLQRLRHSIPNLVNPDIEYTDDRVRKNGFRVKLAKGEDGSECLEIVEMANAVSYYNAEDLRWIFRQVGLSETGISLAKSRPFKVVQYLQSEAVRMSYSLPVHSSVLENLDDLGQNLSGDFRDWKCFHQKDIFHSVFQFSKKRDIFSAK